MLFSVAAIGGVFAAVVVADAPLAAVCGGALLLAAVVAGTVLAARTSSPGPRCSVTGTSMLAPIATCTVCRDVCHPGASSTHDFDGSGRHEVRHTIEDAVQFDAGNVHALTPGGSGDGTCTDTCPTRVRSWSRNSLHD